MNFALDEDHLALKASAATFLDKEISYRRLLVPGATVADAGYDQHWRKIVDMGWQGIVIPEAYDGLGLTCIDLAMVLGEMGRTLAPSPFLGNLLGTWALLNYGTAAQKTRLLPKIAAGELRLALAVADSKGNTDRVSPEAVATDGKITGVKSLVIDADGADLLIVAAADAEGSGRSFYLVESGAAGVGVDVLDWRDVTRQLCEVRLTSVQAERMNNDTPARWGWLRDRILFALSAESAGGAAAVQTQATDYAKQRVAFGKPIGAYQAIKHSLADMLAQVECANVAVLYAAWTLAEDTPQAALAAAMAKAYCGDAYVTCANRSIQIFGAIGFTWEMNNHLYLKRALANAELFGNSTSHRSRVIDLAPRAAA